MYVCMYVRMYVRMYVHVCMYACMCKQMQIHILKFSMRSLVGRHYVKEEAVLIKRNPILRNAWCCVHGIGFRSGITCPSN